MPSHPEELADMKVSMSLLCQARGSWKFALGWLNIVGVASGLRVYCQGKVVG